MARIGIDAHILASSKTHLHAGTSRVAFQVLDRLHELQLDHEFVVFVDASVELPEAWADPKIQFVRVAEPQKTVWAFMKAPGLARAHRLDFWLSLGPVVPVTGKFRRGMFVYDLFPLTMPETVTKKLHWTMRLTLPPGCSKADIIFTDSEFARQDVHRHFQTPLSKIQVAYLGPGNIATPRTRESVTAEELREIGVPEGPFLFTLSTLEPRKNLPRVIEAFSRLIRTPGHEDLNLVIAGAKGWLYDAIFQQVEALGVAERVKFLGFVPTEAIPALFAACEAYVAGSISEGFGIPVLEGHLYGAPVISSRGGSLPEVGGDAAFYFDPLDVADIERGLREGLIWARDRDAILAAGRAQASKFSWAHCVDTVIEGVERVLAKS